MSRTTDIGTSNRIAMSSSRRSGKGKERERDQRGRRSEERIEKYDQDVDMEDINARTGGLSVTPSAVTEDQDYGSGQYAGNMASRNDPACYQNSAIYGDSNAYILDPQASTIQGQDYAGYEFAEPPDWQQKQQASIPQLGYTASAQPQETEKRGKVPLYGACIQCAKDKQKCESGKRPCKRCSDMEKECKSQVNCRQKTCAACKKVRKSCSIVLQGNFPCKRCVDDDIQCIPQADGPEQPGFSQVHPHES